MPVFEIEDPSTGRTIELEGDSPPTEQELEQIFSELGTAPPSVPPEEPGFLSELVGGAEAVGAFTSGIVAEPLAGLAGGATTLLAGPEAGEAVIKGTREALTFQPETEIGKKRVANIAGALQPLGEVLTGAEKFLGDAVFNATPFLDPDTRAAASATAASMPAAILEILNVRGLKRAAKVKAGVEDVAVGRKAKKLLTEAVQTKETLFAQTDVAYGAIDNLGASIKPKAYNALVNRISRRMDIKEGITPSAQPHTSSTLSDIERFVDRPVNLKRLENLRRNAKANANKAAAAGDDLDARLAESIASDIDNFLDEGGMSVVDFPKGKIPKDVGLAYKEARKLASKAKKTQDIEDMVENAGRARSGFRPGLEAEFAKLVKNKRRSRFWKKSELKIMDDFAQGKTGAQDKMIRLIAGLSPTEGGVNRRILSTLVQGGIGAGFGGIAGAPIGPALGYFAHTLSKAGAEDIARFLKNTVAAGDDGAEIAKAYIRTTPKRLRNAEDLGNILLERGARLENLAKTEFMREVIEAVNRKNRALISGTAATSGIVSTKEDLE